MLVAGCLHASWNLIAKQANADRMSVLLGASAFNSIAMLPWGITHLPAHRVFVVGLSWIGARGLLNVVYLIGLSKSYHFFDLSMAYPMVRGIGPVVAMVLAVVLLGERPAVLGIAGVAVTSAAILAMSSIGRVERRAAGRISPQALWMVMTGITIGGYTVVDKVSLRYWDPVSYLWALELTGTCVLSVVLTRQRRIRAVAVTVRRNWRTVASCAALGSGSYLLALLALEHSLASYVAPLREVSVLFGTILGLAVLKEDHGRMRMVAAAGIASGLILVGFAL